MTTFVKGEVTMNRGNLIRRIHMECPICDKVHEIEERTRITELIIKGEEVCEKEKEQAITDFLDERKRVLSEAEAKAQAAYDEILKAGEARAEALKKNCADRVSGAAETVIGRIFG